MASIITHPKKTDVLLNQAFIVLNHPQFSCFSKELNREKIISLITDQPSRDEFIHNNPGVYKQFVETVRDLTRFRQIFAEELSAIASHPDVFLGKNFTWKYSQQECLESLSWALSHGYQRLPFELPTGGGKSHVLGALAAGYLRAAQRCGRDDEIVLLTSRLNLVDQLIGFEENEEGNEINYGDVLQWVDPLISEDQIRIIAGNYSKKELKKNARLTVETYAGFSEERIKKIHSNKPVGLILCDETHNITEHKRSLINGELPGALIVGGSATIKGPNRRIVITRENTQYSKVDRVISGGKFW